MQKKLIAFYRLNIALSIMLITGSIGLLLKWISFGLLTEFNRKYLIANSSQLILFLIGIKLKTPEKSAFPKQQVLYTFNHNSFFDVLIVTALGLPNTKVFLSEKTKKIIPLTISAMSIDTLFIPQKQDAERRLKFFKEVAIQIKKEGFSVFASSEGVHNFIHGIAPFNKGIYHLAKVCNIPVVPLYFHIPEETNPFEGSDYKKGIVKVEILETVQTENWQLSQLAESVENVREMFIRKFNEAHYKTN